MCTLKDMCHSCTSSLLDQSSSYDLNMKPEQQRSVGKVISRSKEHSSATTFINHQLNFKQKCLIFNTTRFSIMEINWLYWSSNESKSIILGLVGQNMTFDDIILGVLGMLHSFLIFYETNNWFIEKITDGLMNNEKKIISCNLICNTNICKAHKHTHTCRKDDVAQCTVCIWSLWFVLCLLKGWPNALWNPKSLFFLTTYTIPCTILSNAQHNLRLKTHSIV